MQKYIKDGKVAILVSPGFGAGWSTWEGKALAYDRRVVEKFFEGTPAKEMQEYLNSIGYKNIYMGGYDHLIVKWLPVGTKYRITEYDGAENLETIESIEWETA